MPIHPQDPSLMSFPSVSSHKNEANKNKYKQKIQKLQDENSKLHESLDQKTEEVSSLTDRIVKLTNSIDSLTLECSSVSTAKVVELSKKNRRLAAELHSIKSKCKTLEESHHDLEELLREKEEKQPPQEIAPPSPSEIQIITEKLDKSTRKVFEVLNQNTQLKNELKMAQKCLQQEIGENVNVSQLLSGNSNWRGRAQEIGLLKNKIADLKEKFETSSFDSYDEASRSPLKRLESMRRLEVESLSKELDDCKSQLEEVKTKVIALKTRNKNLSDDSNNYKLKTLDLLEKSSRDEEFIKCLNEQIAMLKYECNHNTEEMKKEVDRAENAQAIAEVEIEKLRCRLNNQQEILSEKENEIGSLKHTIEELEHSVREMSGDFLFSCRQMNKDEYIKLLKNLEEEKNNLLSYMQQLNERLDKESVKVSEQQDTIHKQKSKILRFEAKLREFENEKTALKVKHRRTMRINEYSQSHSSSSIALVRPATHSKEKFIAEIDKQKFKLEVAMERISFLEQKIKDQNDERQEDNQKFVEIISKSKEIFKNLFDSKDGGGDKASECPDTSLNSTINSTFTEI